MLDDLKMISSRDKSDTLAIAQKEINQLADKFEITIKPKAEIKNVVFAGMGGSALYAEFARSWPGMPVPYEITKQYDIPAYVDQNSLFIASSFSGNTEETLSALTQAEAAGATIVVITGGGKLADIAEQKGYPMAKLDGSIPQPRMASLNGWKALTTILEAAGLVEAKTAEMESLIDKMNGFTDSWAVAVPTSKNAAKQLANDLMGRSMVIYAGPLCWPLAYKWKISFNENAKNVAWCNFYPELNHNEFIGWASHPVEKPYGIINLHSSFEHPKIDKRMEVSDKLLSGRRPAPFDVELQGQTLLEQMVWGLVFGDFVSLYVALLNGLDPAPVDLVEKLKKEL